MYQAWEQCAEVSSCALWCLAPMLSSCFDFTRSLVYDVVHMMSIRAPKSCRTLNDSALQCHSISFIINSTSVRTNIENFSVIILTKLSSFIESRC
jgi:hypothetical protein